MRLRKGKKAAMQTRTRKRIRAFHGRSSISVDQCASYLDAAAARIEAGGAIPRKLPSLVPLPLDDQPSPSPSPPPSAGDKRRRCYLDGWLPALKAHLKKPHMAPCSEADYGGPLQSSPLPSTNFSCLR
ncbi:hypothetical protein pqer_cds_1163 [Pandoravirus quercus]|uniref:Uncharacterized protein n=1 Tax=Pandoravirus quercus TaxID=2107709 RepID=A0A2U7UB27_9VIRU|nr:hypothetical protein pqer_cds_1163 [Pandoravirus quercus]AVK75585.1 hypothetical protein pqer_cds_1163 [Pandoravirus quercus]